MSSSFPPQNLGQQNVAQDVQVMELTANSQAQKAAHDATLQNLEIQKIAANLNNVPTLPHDVRAALRQRGHPVRLFGENLADVRQRLRMALALEEWQRQTGERIGTTTREGSDDEEEEEVTKYTRASPALVEARQAIASFSLERAKQRMERERTRRAWALQHKKQSKRTLPQSTSRNSNTEDDALDQLDEDCRKHYQFIQQVGLEGSQYGDARALSSIVCTTFDQQPLILTGSWTSSVHAWNTALEPQGKHTLCHEDRIMDMDTLVKEDTNHHDSILLATASIDKTAKLFQISKSPDVVMQDDTEDTEQDDDTTNTVSFEELHHFQGHEARLCRIRFHPMQRHVGTTSFDHSWRLWDLETGQSLLLQDGHADKVFAMSFHGDGSLVATADFASIIHLWDLRTGKTVHHFPNAHAKRILTADWSPNGFQLATAGDDGSIKIWDIRRRKQAVAGIPAHSQLISKLVYQDESLVSSSFDGTVKIWSAREWKMLNCLRGHEGKVSSVDVVPGQKGGIVTCGFDKTLKFWK